MYTVSLVMINKDVSERKKKGEREKKKIDFDFDYSTGIYMHTMSSSLPRGRSCGASDIRRRSTPGAA